MDAAIQIKNLVKVYKNFWGRRSVNALQAVNLTVPRGQLLGLVGLNGSGKTTTIKILLGLLYPTAGSVTVLGCKPSDHRKNGKIGFLPEESLFYKFLNATETLDFYGALYGIPRRERRRRTGELIEKVGLAGAKKRKLKEYSKGMLRRIGLAQAMINRPELIILDEPTSGLDPLGMDMAFDLIREAHDWGATILLSTHMFEQVQTVLDEVTVLHAGKLCGRAPLHEGQVQTDTGPQALRPYFRNCIGLP